MFPKRYESILFGFLLSGAITFLVSGTSTLRAVGLGMGFMHLWIGAWVMAWSVAFPAVLFAGPFTRRVVHRLVRQ